MINAIIILVAFIIFCVWAYRSDKRDYEKNELEIRAKSAKWLFEERDRPRYFVRTHTKKGEAYRTASFEPTSSIYYITYSYSIDITSLGHAQNFIEDCIRSNRYCHGITNVYIPMCEIEYMEAVIE